MVLILAVNLLLTGAFHEDGWADVWDGFGGGWNKQQKLVIMKDSRLGTYGASALMLALLLKYQSLVLLADSLLLVLMVFIVANTLSRANATSLIASMNYVQEDQLSKVKPITQYLPKTSLALLLITSIGVLVFAYCANVFPFMLTLLISYSISA